MKDLYYILGVDSNCTLGDIKEAYRKLSKKFHPDVNQGDDYFDSRFREIQEAYETLSDSAKRDKYDIELEKFKLNQTKSSYKPNYRSARQTYEARFSHFDMSKRKGPGMGLIITLIVVALIFGVYLVQSYTSKKKHIFANITETPAVATVAVHHHYHKKHFNLNSKIGGFAKVKKDSAAVKPSQPIAIINKKSTPVDGTAPIAVNIKPAPVINKPLPPVVSQPAPQSNNDGSIYSTYIKPNATGIVNMRRYDNYSSSIIKTIPANSKVSVLEKGDTYYKVSFDNAVGYVPKWALLSK